MNINNEELIKKKIADKDTAKLKYKQKLNSIKQHYGIEFDVEHLKNNEVENIRFVNLKYKMGYNDLIGLYNETISESQRNILDEYLECKEKQISNDNWNNEFKAFLLKHSLTAKKVADITGLSKPTIDSYMQGKRKPTDANKQILKEKIEFDVLRSMYNFNEVEYEFCTNCGKKVIKNW